MDRFFQDHRVEPRIAMEMPSNETIKQAVIAGMGLSFLSLHTLGLELRCGLIEIVHVEDSPIVRTWNIVHMQSKILSPAAEALRYFILEHGEAHLVEHDRPWMPPPTQASGGGASSLRRTLP
jgi:DNA-binding transcriptional LysR family regulator